MEGSPTKLMIYHKLSLFFHWLAHRAGLKEEDCDRCRILKHPEDYPE